ncbi:MAG: hypothetical protein Q4G68_08070 [Planctomycetia bacterium]|nr:hypothetical protein [Planctomycetia bacterium]
MKKHLLCMCAAAAALFALCFGCQQEPKVDDASFGTVVDQLPELSDRPESFTLPEGVESQDCPVANGEHRH